MGNEKAFGEMPKAVCDHTVNDGFSAKKAEMSFWALMASQQKNGTGGAKRIERR